MVEAIKLRNADSHIQAFSKYVKSFDKGEKVNNLFALNFAVMATNSILMPVRESLTLEGGKKLQTRLMMLTVLVSITGQAIFAYYSGKYGGLLTLRFCFYLSSMCCIVTYCCLIFAPDVRMLFSSAFYLWFTFYNMTSMSTFWAIAGDVLEERSEGATKEVKSKPHGNKIGIFSHLAAGGTLGHMIGSSLSTVLLKEIGTKLCLMVLGVGFFSSVSLCTRIESYQKLHIPIVESSGKEKVPASSASETSASPSEIVQNKKRTFSVLLTELKDQIDNIGMIWDNPILRYSFLYSIMQSTSLGLTVIERTIAAKSSGLDADDYARLLAGNQTLHGALQFLIQFFGSG